MIREVVWSSVESPRRTRIKIHTDAKSDRVHRRWEVERCETGTWLRPRLVQVKEMKFAIMDYACAVGRIDDGTISADDIHHAPVFHRALFHLLRVQTLGVTSGDVASQSLSSRRAKLGCDTRLWVLKKRKYRRGALKNVA